MRGWRDGRGDAALAALVAVLWAWRSWPRGSPLDAFSAPELTVLRFVVAPVPALVTIVLAATILGQPCTPRQAAGTALGILGLGVIAATVGEDLTMAGLALALLVAAGASALAFGERFGGARLAGMALVLAGIAVIVLPVRRGHASTPESA